MNPIILIYYISWGVWIFPPMRQYKNKYFLFFLISATSDIISYFLKESLGGLSNLPKLFFICLLIFSLHDKTKYKTAAAWLLPLYIIIVIVSLSLNDRYTELYFGLFLYLIVLFFIVTDFFKFTIDTHQVSLFLFILTLYQTLNVLKIFNILLSVYEGIYYYYTTGIFQILIGVFFSVYAFDNAKLNFKLVAKRKLTSQ